jgi:hemerythrin-like domain-containing protein
MKPTEVLKADHRVIERVLGALERGARRLDASEAVDPSFFVIASDFIKGFADGCHHSKEEGVLFPALQAAGIPSAGGPIGVMLYEHDLGRQFTAAMRAAAERLQTGDASAREEVVRAASAYASLLRQHIAKEDNILFMMADRVLDADAQTRIVDEFERVEHEETGEGGHERYLELAATLERLAAA